jgi:hypothetical protein
MGTERPIVSNIRWPENFSVRLLIEEDRQKNDAQASIARFFGHQFFCLKSTNLAAANPQFRRASGRAPKATLVVLPCHA